MNNWLKHKYFVPGLIVFLLVAFIFYWFQLRPSIIRHDCSWVARHQDAVSEKPAQEARPLSPAELDRCKTGNIFDSELDKLICRQKTKMFVPAQDAQLAKDWWERASDSQYKFCLRDKGL